MELRILGPFEVCASGGEVKVPAGRERALLAVLALHRGEVVSVDALVDALWGELPPSTAAKAVQGYVSHLRRLLEPAGEDGTLVTQAPGYVLRVDDSQVDARRFETLVAQGWRRVDHDPAAALSVFDEALALWRGSALSEFTFAEFAQREIRRLEELRLETIEGRIEAQLRLGRHDAVVAELATRVEEHPLRERLRGQLMLALYRCGRQAEALEVYRDGRSLLADELGLDPGTDLQRLERAILAQDPALEVSAAPAEERQAPGDGKPPSVHRKRRLRVLAMGVVLLVVAVAGITVGYLLVRDDTPASIAITPPALAVIDPATNRIVASIAVGSRPVSVAARAGSVWVGDARDGTVTRIEAVTRRVTKTIGIGAPAVDLAAGADGVWVATGGFGEVVRIEPELGAVVDRIALGEAGDPVVPSVAAIGVGDGRVWAGAFDGLAQIDPRSGQVVRKVDLGRSSALQIAVGDGAVWATTIASRAKRVEASSARETTEFYAGSWVYPIVLGGGSVWVAGGSGQIWKVDPVTGSSVLTSRALTDLVGIAVGAGKVWVTSFSEPKLACIDAETGDLVATIPIGGPAADVAFYAGLVWVPVSSAD